MAKSNLKNIIPREYSPGIWIMVIILAFVIGFVFTFLANKLKSVPTQEHMLSAPYTGSPNKYNWNSIQSTLSTNYQNQMRSGIIGPLSASGNQAISCHYGQVPNFYNRNGGPCCVTNDGLDYTNQCCLGVNRKGQCAQWDELSSKVVMS
tara:strand:- start:450 stop:896 length:447 start_codon:yes stop_codon:yes gene_type:complete